MDKLEELKKQLKELSPEEAAAFKEFLNNEVASTSENEVLTEGNNIEESKNEVLTAEPAQSFDENKEAVADTETPKEISSELETDESKESETNNFEKEENVPSVQAEDIPTMQKGAEVIDDEASEALQQLTSDTGEELPIDYEQIIEGQNAKIAALQAENTSLKTKVDGAFGYSAKPSNQVKVNRLYDDALDVHFRK